MKIRFSFLFILFSSIIFAQNQTFRGKINSAEGPVSNANIYIDGLKLGTTSNDEGYFELHLSNQLENDKKYTFKVSKLGYQTWEDSFVWKQATGVEKNIILIKKSECLKQVVIIDEQTGLNNLTPYSIKSLDVQKIELIGNPSGIVGNLREQNTIHGAEMGQGIVKPFIRGLGFTRVVTIYQSNKLENHQWGADHGLGINDLGIGSAEVIKGPSSILYGSGAIGGVILLKDDEHYINSEPKLSGKAGFTFNSVSMGLRPTLSMGQSFKNGIFVAAEGAVESHADYLDGNGRAIGNSRFNSQTFRFHTGIQKQNFKNKLSYTYHNQYLGIIEDDEMNDEESLATFRSDRKMQLPFQSVNDHLFSYKQNYDFKKFSTSLNLSYHLNNRKEIEENFDEIDLGLIQSHFFYNFRATHQTSKIWSNTLGFQGSYLHNRNNETAEEILIPDGRFFETGIYYLSAFNLEKLNILGGLRYDHRSVTADASAPHIVEYGYVLPGDPADRRLSRIFSGFTGSIGASKFLGKNNLLKINFSTGFRAPDMAELFSNGPHPGTNRFEVGNVNFNREQSIQMDLNWTYENDWFKFSTSFYGNTVNNYIFFQGTGEVLDNGLEIWAFSQTDALLYGNETEFSILPFKDKKLEISGAANIVRGEDLTNEGWLTFIPADNYFLRVSSKPLSKVNTSIFAAYRFVNQQNRPGINEIFTPSYSLLSAGVSHQFIFEKSLLNAGISGFNLLNQVYIDHISILRAFEITHPGRNLMVNLQYTF